MHTLLSSATGISSGTFPDPWGTHFSQTLSPWPSHRLLPCFSPRHFSRDGAGGGGHEELEARAPTCLTVSDTATQSHCVPGGPRLSPLELPHQEFAASSKHIPDLAQRTTPLQGPTAILAESDGQQKLRGAHADWLLSLLLPFILHTSHLPQKPSD